MKKKTKTKIANILQDELNESLRRFIDRPIEASMPEQLQATLNGFVSRKFPDDASFFVVEFIAAERQPGCFQAFPGNLFSACILCGRHYNPRRLAPGQTEVTFMDGQVVYFNSEDRTYGFKPRPVFYVAPM
jgi:hypothetical protein